MVLYFGSSGSLKRESRTFVWVVIARNVCIQQDGIPSSGPTVKPDRYHSNSLTVGLDIYVAPGKDACDDGAYPGLSMINCFELAVDQFRSTFSSCQVKVLLWVQGPRCQYFVRVALGYGVVELVP
jgi:hypothetical protein